MVKFSFKGSKVTHNANQQILKNKLTIDEICDLVSYHSKLSIWWEYNYNSNQPVKVIRF